MSALAKYCLGVRWTWNRLNISHASMVDCAKSTRRTSVAFWLYLYIGIVYIDCVFFWQEYSYVATCWLWLRRDNFCIVGKCIQWSWISASNSFIYTWHESNFGRNINWNSINKHHRKPLFSSPSFWLHRKQQQIRIYVFQRSHHSFSNLNETIENSLVDAKQLMLFFVCELNISYVMYFG